MYVKQSVKYKYACQTISPLQIIIFKISVDILNNHTINNRHHKQSYHYKQTSCTIHPLQWISCTIQPLQWISCTSHPLQMDILHNSPLQLDILHNSPITNGYLAQFTHYKQTCQTIIPSEICISHTVYQVLLNGVKCSLLCCHLLTEDILKYQILRLHRNLSEKFK